MSPCGMAMDFARRSYRQDAEFGEERGDAKGSLRWYPCAPGAKAFPAPHAFISTLWEGKDLDLWDDFGVGPGVYAKPWSPRTNRYQAPPGNHYHGTLAWFASGIPAEVLSGEVPPPPPDPECPPVGLTVQDVSGSTVNATYDEVTLIRADRARGQGVELHADPGEVTLFDLPGARPWIRPIHLDSSLTDPDRVAVQLTPGDTGSVLVAGFGPATPGAGSYRAFLPPAATLPPGFCLWAFLPLDQVGVNIIVHPAPGETLAVQGFGFSSDLIRAVKGTSLWVLLQQASGRTTWLQLIPDFTPVPLQVGTTGILGGGVVGDLLRISSGGLLGSVSGVSGTFGGP